MEGAELVLRMGMLEKAEGFHGDIRVPLRAVTSVRVVDDAWPDLRGMRAPGTGLPDVIAVGTRRGGFGKDFAAVHGKGPAVVVELAGCEFERLIVTSEDAAQSAETIRSARLSRTRPRPGALRVAGARGPSGTRRVMHRPDDPLPRFAYERCPDGNAVHSVCPRGLPSSSLRTYVRREMERQFELESLRRSLAMLRPGAPALDREEAMRLVRELQALERQVRTMREGLVRLLAESA